ncbi:MAG TPA: sigma-70 family RNA polymerase sigma factor [Kofleriaceae bacterium]|nr:sigma-70 family RNA polymerase sigma factor [Kofleriaceae bacterium]
MAESVPEVAEGIYAVYERELSYVWKTLGRLGVPAADLADAAHDVFVIVHRRWADIDFERPIRPWLFGVARRVAAGMRRKHRELPSQHLQSVVDASPHAERDLLWRVLASLDDDRRAVVILHDLEGYTGAEIGEILGISANTVHSRLRLAREDMRATLSKLRGAP